MKILSLINEQFIEAAKSNQMDELKNLLDRGADIHANDNMALGWSAKNGHLETVKFLITKGANIHANDDEALKKTDINDHYDVWQVLSAFIQEEKLLVAASDSMLLVAAVGSTSASSCLCGMPQNQQAELKKSIRSKI